MLCNWWSRAAEQGLVSWWDIIQHVIRHHIGYLKIRQNFSLRNPERNLLGSSETWQKKGKCGRFLKFRCQHLASYLVWRERHGPQSPIMCIYCLQQSSRGQVIQLQPSCLWDTEWAQLWGAHLQPPWFLPTWVRKGFTTSANTAANCLGNGSHAPYFHPNKRYETPCCHAELTPGGWPCWTTMQSYSHVALDSWHFHWLPDFKKDLSWP